MEKKINEIYNELGEEKVEQLYMYGCLKASGFNDENALLLVDTLKNLWLKDEYNRCISLLSDKLYDYSKKCSIKDILNEKADYTLSQKEFEIEE